jgi:hypothetical protein
VTQSFRSAMAIFRTIDRPLPGSSQADASARSWGGGPYPSRARPTARSRQPGYLACRPVALRPRLATGVPVG